MPQRLCVGTIQGTMASLRRDAPQLSSEHAPQNEHTQLASRAYNLLAHRSVQVVDTTGLRACVHASRMRSNVWLGVWMCGKSESCVYGC